MYLPNRASNILNKFGWLILSPVLFVFLFACEKVSTKVGPIQTETPLIDKHFNFSTTNEVDVAISAKDAQGKPIRMTNIQIFDKDPEEGGILLMKGGTDNTGKLSAFKAIPSYITEVTILGNYLGVPDKIIVPVSNQRISYIFTPVLLNSGERLATANARTTVGPYTFMGAYNKQGVPAYLSMPNDVIDADFLTAINTSLPERQKVNPAYLASGLSTDVSLVKETELIITFVNEGGSYKNAFGYYTYPLATPPQSAADIDTKTIVFPNASFTGSGGGLASGNKVKLPGKIPAGTGVGFFIVVNGWNGTSISETADILFSNPALNAGTPAQKQQSVLLNYKDKYILAFEDKKRSLPGSDDDFNDVMFYITSLVPDAVDDEEIPPTEEEEDCDKDGVPDENDAYPCDEKQAYDNVSEGTLAFEDLWPSKGDFDMNDLVVNYKHNIITNSQNKVVELKSTFDLIAMGARYKNGFGFQIPKLTSSQIASITSSHDKTLLENGQDKATILVFENAFDFVPSGQDAMINTYAHLPKVTCGIVTISIKFNTALTMQELGSAPFNPFLIGDQKRGYEVHLPGYLPTSKADLSLFGTKDDASLVAEGIYYKTAEGMPFALHLPVGKFKYPVEMAAITQTHLKFTPWAISNGTTFADWYLDLPGYRDATKIYNQ
ncbi:LruC domain-containing protein [Rhodocytophaga rosea]|uniref:LruC domain-containing protein n=1 Tax=Rhodocytophaga rosea TaxID=2704465 RepID=A0A6C0GDX0_9BACT|nr:LruC domain-containing protein [Rhodocytophaga rosea]QHT65880.1 LruC domain-containing protein [Rhodocytophaga rosea]